MSEEVTITIFGISVDVKMIILNKNDKPILIGLDWMSEAVIDLGNKSIRFGARSYNFNETDDYDSVDLNDHQTLQCAISEIYTVKAKINVDKAQIIQKRNQDKHHKIIETLKPGTKVFIKTSNLLLKKLDECFIVPYTVHTVSQRGNYWLLNEKNMNY